MISPPSSQFYYVSLSAVGEGFLFEAFVGCGSRRNRRRRGVRGIAGHTANPGDSSEGGLTLSRCGGCRFRRRFSLKALRRLESTILESRAWSTESDSRSSWNRRRSLGVCISCSSFVILGESTSNWRYFILFTLSPTHTEHMDTFMDTWSASSCISAFTHSNFSGLILNLLTFLCF